MLNYLHRLAGKCNLQTKCGVKQLIQERSLKSLLTFIACKLVHAQKAQQNALRSAKCTRVCVRLSHLSRPQTITPVSINIPRHIMQNARACACDYPTCMSRFQTSTARFQFLTDISESAVASLSLFRVGHGNFNFTVVMH